MRRKALSTVLSCLLSLALLVTVLSHSAGMVARANAHVPDNDVLHYYGGPVMPGTMNVYAIFWFPGDKGAMNSYMSLIERYFQDVGNNRLYNMLFEYAGDNGTPTSAVLAGAWEDIKTSYNPQISRQDLINEVKLAIAKNNWPMGGYNYYFPVYTLPDANVGSHFTGGHGSFGPQDNPTITGIVTYCSSGTSCVVPTHPNDPNSYATDGAINYSAHEQFEAATDAGVELGLGWRGAGEIGDICSYQFGPTPYPYDYGQANQDWLSSQGIDDYYIIQGMANNSTQGCSLGS